VPRHVTWRCWVLTGSSDRLNIAAIGAGGKRCQCVGVVLIFAMLGRRLGEKVVALCDVDFSAISKEIPLGIISKAKLYADFRECWTKEKDIVCYYFYPRHVHGPAAAICYGSDGVNVYVQKAK